MTERENFLEVIRFGAPEYIPTRIPNYGIGYYGCDHEGFDNPHGHDVPIGTHWNDIWGTTWIKEYNDVMGFPRGFPLSDINALDQYVFPNPNDPAIYQRIYDRAQGYPGGEPGALPLLTGSHRDTLWEKSYMLCGMEQMMEWFFTEPNHARVILKRIMDFQLGIAKHYVALNVGMVNLGDDLGTQNSLLLSPRIIREFLMPEYARLCDFYTSRGVMINFHSCGHIQPITDIFIELGIDILNPIQATANDLKILRKNTQGKLALCGGVSTNLLLTGDMAQIRAETRRVMTLLGKDGGYICTPDQYMPFVSDIIDGFHAYVRDNGRYPLYSCSG